MHHRIIESIKGATRRFVGYNFTFVFVLSLFPIACLFMNEAGTKHIEGLRQFSFVFYMVINLLASVIQVQIMSYIINHRSEFIFDDELLQHDDQKKSSAYYKHAQRKMYLNIFPIVIAFFFPAFAFVGYVGVAFIVMQSLKRVNHEK